MNADAAVAALLLDAGLPRGAIDLVTSIGRCVGLAAHVNEEAFTSSRSARRRWTSIEYVGPGEEA